ICRGSCVPLATPVHPVRLSSLLQFLQHRTAFPVRCCTGILTGTCGRPGSGGLSARSTSARSTTVSELHDSGSESARKRKQREGRMTERASLGDVSGSWKTSVNSINALIADLVQPTTEVARVLVAVAEGDLTQKMALEIEGQPVKGEFLRIGTTVNAMVDQLS